MVITTITSTTNNVIGIEAFIFIALMFYLLYLANSYENTWIKLALKLFSTIIGVAIAYMPLISVGLGNQTKMYEDFATSYMWGFMLFWFVWFTIFLWEMFSLFLKKDKVKLEETQ